MEWILEPRPSITIRLVSRRWPRWRHCESGCAAYVVVFQVEKVPSLKDIGMMHAQVTPQSDEHAEPQEEIARDSTRPIRALNRGLDVLTELNRLERAAINTLAAAVGLPRTTTYRILETLRLAGYVDRDAHDDCYRPTIMVRALSDGFDDEALVAHIAKPLLAALGSQIVWPVAVATPSGSTMMIRETTDRQSPLALEQYSAGVRVPMLASAAGRAYLAFCSAQQRDAMLELLARSSLPEDRLARNRIEVERLLNETRTQGFGMAHRARRVSEETSLAIPVRAKDRILASVTVRYAATAVPLRTAVEQFLPKMREVAQKIEAQFI
jgi:IclR family transcriptional regulator, mhp operon transcriptional activator